MNSLNIVFWEPSLGTRIPPSIPGNAARVLTPAYSDGGLRVVTECRCGEFRHRTYRKLAQCAHPRSSATGEGEFALVLRCYYPRDTNEIVCLGDLEVAERALDRLDAEGCWSHCRGDHELVRLQLEASDD